MRMIGRSAALSLGVLLGSLPALQAQEATPEPAAKLDLQTCLQLGFENQPALNAARASLAAAESAQRGLNQILIGRFLTPDLAIRKQQSCWGVRIAQATLFQAEWETRYAVTRNYYSVVYARMQSEVLTGLVDKLDRSAKTAESIVKAGDPKVPVTQIDVETLRLNRDFYKAKSYEAIVGVDRAKAALREAIGVKHNYPLDTVADKLPTLINSLSKEELIAVALTQRGEMMQAYGASQVTCLEIRAQGKICSPTARTFAMGSDIHANQIPQGIANGEYRPGAIGLEMPPMMAGPKSERVQRARDLHARAGAVVEKTENLIALEVEAAYLKWREAYDKTKALENTPAMALKIRKSVEGRFDNGNATGEEMVRARTNEDQARAQLNEALYNHALALAALERVTAGGYAFPATRMESLPAPK